MIEYNSQIDLETVKLEDIDLRDYPQFEETVITYAEYLGGLPLDEDELEELSNDRDLISNLVLRELGFKL